MIAEEYGIFPIQGYWISCDLGEYSGHRGTDIGWHESADMNAPIWAWKSGTVVFSGFDGDHDRGYVVTIRHENANGTYTYSSYYHLQKQGIANGTVVKQGDEIGNRGGTKNATSSYGVHLHFAVSQPCSAKLEGMEAVNWARNNNVDPMTNVWLDPTKKYVTEYILKGAVCDDKTNMGRYRDLRWLQPIPCKPVERNPEVHQYEVLVDNIRLRKGPGKSAECIGNITRGIYNVLEQQEADGYIWNKVSEGYWSAFCEGDCIDYPVIKPEEEIAKLKAQIKELEKDKEVLSEENSRLNSIIDEAIAVLSKSK